MNKYHIRRYSTYSSIKAVYNYNNTKHSTIKCSPHKAQINQVTIKRKTLQINTSNKLKFKINDKVRISNKGYTPNWTTEVFTISKILNTDPLTYQLKDSSNNIILGYFYTQELKKKHFFPTPFSLNDVNRSNLTLVCFNIQSNANPGAVIKCEASSLSVCKQRSLQFSKTSEILSSDKLSASELRDSDIKRNVYNVIIYFYYRHHRYQTFQVSQLSYSLYSLLMIT
ncbi:hypothetical protein AGLY_011530 [Aphis glycines]|uniref:Uncharacterized protein n=1 Tax=Aphis glycines TaxID=307491 RepID=A0A6G0TBS2_APHGL|nr:hypothetical protein AGLY_011530 [Aphis glycines]